MRAILFPWWTDLLNWTAHARRSDYSTGSAYWSLVVSELLLCYRFILLNHQNIWRHYLSFPLNESVRYLVCVSVMAGNYFLNKMLKLEHCYLFVQGLWIACIVESLVNYLIIHVLVWRYCILCCFDAIQWAASRYVALSAYTLYI